MTKTCVGYIHQFALLCLVLGIPFATPLPRATAQGTVVFNETFTNSSDWSLTLPRLEITTVRFGINMFRTR